MKVLFIFFGNEMEAKSIHLLISIPLFYEYAKYNYDKKILIFIALTT